jgi:hypothetical protein
VSGWHPEKGISTYLHILGRLSREVCFFYSLPYDTNQHFRVLIATIKDMGSCPCPRCLIPKTSFDLLGLFGDMRDHLVKVQTYCLAEVIKARGFIYKFGNMVDGSKVWMALGEGSWVPTVVSAFRINSHSMHA